MEKQPLEVMKHGFEMTLIQLLATGFIDMREYSYYLNTVMATKCIEGFEAGVLTVLHAIGGKEDFYK